jgi:isomerase DpgB
VLDGPAALAAGLVDELVARPELAVRTLVERLGPGREWAVRRRLILDATTPVDDALGAHLAAIDRTARRATAGTAR